jgi:hypothetical protein
MGAIGKFLRNQQGGQLAFWCPGCDEAHAVKVEGKPRWEYNGKPDCPTFSPSILVRGRDFTLSGQTSYDAWCAAGFPKPAPQFEAADTCCHSFVTDGRIQFLSDCTHALAGRVVDLPPFPGNEEELSS